MKFEAKKIKETGQGVWTVIVDGKEWEEAITKGKNKAAANVEIPGFRKGKAPKEKVEQYVTPSKYLQEALQGVLDKAWNFAREQKTDIQPFSSPNPEAKKISETALTLDFVFDLKPEIKIEKYKGITDKSLVKESAKATKEEMDQAIDQYRERFAMEKDKPSDAKIAKGDVVKFDFEGFIDGEAFKGGKGLDFVLPIGSGRMIPGFEDSMIGKGIGETSINVTFPEDYTEGLSGKKAEFKLNIKEIKERTLPAKDDELAKDLNIKDVTTYKQLEDYVKKQVENNKVTQNKNIFVNSVIDIIRKNSVIELPKSVIDKEVVTMFREFEARVQAQKLSMKEYKKQTGMTDEDIKKELFDDAKARLESYLITDQVRNSENIQATDKEIDAKYEELAASFGIKVEDIKGNILPVEQVKEEIVREKIIDFLYNNNGGETK